MPPSGEHSRFWRCWAELLFTHLEELDCRHHVPVLNHDIMCGEGFETQARQ